MELGVVDMQMNLTPDREQIHSESAGSPQRQVIGAPK